MRNYLADSRQVYLFYWQPRINNCDTTGHIALKVSDQEQSTIANTYVGGLNNPNTVFSLNNLNFYASHWPVGNKSVWPCCTQGEFHSQQTDERYYSQHYNIRPTTLKIESELNIARITARFAEFYSKQPYYSLWAEIFSCGGYIQNCSVLVMDLLRAGGIDKHLIIYRYWGFLHLFLLASAQIFILEMAFLAVGFYQSLQQQRKISEDHDNWAIFGEVSLLIFLNSLPFIICNWLANKDYNYNNKFIRFISYLGFKNFAQPRLAIMNNFDIVVGIVASLIMGFTFLAYRNWFTPMISHLEKNNTHWMSWVIDLPMVPALMISSAWLGKKLVSLFLTLFFWQGYLDHPASIYQWVKTLNQNRFLHQNNFQLEKIILAKELLLLLMILLTYIAIYIFRKALPNYLHRQVEISLYGGLTVGISLSYMIVKLIYCYFNQQIFTQAWQDYGDQQHDYISRDQLTTSQAIVKKYDYDLEWYSLIALCSSLGMVGFFDIFSYHTPLSTAGESALTVLGTSLGLIAGLLIYGLLKKLCFPTRATIYSISNDEDSFDNKDDSDNKDKPANLELASTINTNIKNIDNKNINLNSYLELITNQVNTNSHIRKSNYEDNLCLDNLDNREYSNSI